MKSIIKFVQLAAVTAAAAFATPAFAVTEIHWWHAMSGQLGRQVEKLAADFNASQSEYRVVPAYKGNYRITDKVVKTGVEPKVEALAKELKLPLIDLYAALSDKPDLFPDQIHPNAGGAKLMAEALAKALKAKAK